MKLSELVAFQNQLEELPSNEAKAAAAIKLDILIHKIEQPLEQSIEQLTVLFLPELKKNQEEIYRAFDQFGSTVNAVKDRVRYQISEQEKFWFQESYKLFEAAEICETTEQILNRSISPNDKTLQSQTILRSKLSRYADWRFSGMIIRPANDDFVDSMVGYDPLYIIDQNYDLLKPCLSRFPKLYQNRLRPYITNDWRDQPILERIPNNQFGVCLAHNVFNYRPLEIIRKYLQEIYQKLRPGGALLMTFNDCDRSSAVMLVEQFYASYTPGYLIRDLAGAIGFELVATWDDEGPSVWLELKKPGELASLRGGQTIATIKERRLVEYDVDFLAVRPYTKEQIDELRKEALVFGIDQDSINAFKPVELGQVVISLRIQKQEQEERLHIEVEEQRVRELNDRAKSVGINPELYTDENELIRHIAEEVDHRRKEELKWLRQRASELEVGDPNLIRYGYSAEKLKQLIKEKESK